MKSRFYILALLVVLVDHVTKWIVRWQMEGSQPIEIVPGFLRLRYVLNSGVAFGLLEDAQFAWKPYVFAGMAVVAVIVIVIYGARAPANRTLLQVALAITTGGIVGNFIDRVTRGLVVDFIEIHVRGYFYWPTFNVADSSITVGIALLLIDTVKNPAE